MGLETTLTISFSYFSDELHKEAFLLSKAILIWLVSVTALEHFSSKLSRFFFSMSSKAKQQTNLICTLAFVHKYSWVEFPGLAVIKELIVCIDGVALFCSFTVRIL